MSRHSFSSNPENDPTKAGRQSRRIDRRAKRLAAQAKFLSSAIERLEKRVVLTGPQVVSIVRNSPAFQFTDSGTVDYTVTFDQNVTGVDAADFQAVTNGTLKITGGVAVNGTGSSYGVEVSGITGSGDLQVNLIDNDTIHNADSQPLGGEGIDNGSFQGPIFSIHQAALGPYVTSISGAMPAVGLTNSHTLLYSVVFSEDVESVRPSDFTLVTTGNVSGTISSVVSSDIRTYQVTVSNVQGSGTLGLNISPTNQIHSTADGAPLRSVGEATFAPASTFYSGTNPIADLLVDVNLDGKLDLVTYNSGVAGPMVALGNGDGSFGDYATYGTTSAPTMLQAADLNGDGYPDLVAAYNSTTVHVLVNNGDGTFGPSSSFALDAAPYSIALGDVNGDGKADLVAGLTSGAIEVLLGNGDGTFGSANTFSVSNPNLIRLGDIDGDGTLDIASLDTSGGVLNVFFGNGDGTFSFASSISTGAAAKDIALADIDTNGFYDAVVDYQFSNAVGVMFGNGNGTFSEALTYAAGSEPISIGVGDVDGDGNLDIVVADYGDNTVGVLLGNGGGYFSDPTTFSAPYGPRSITLGDINNDGNLDILAANYSSYYTTELLNAPAEIAGDVYTIDTIPPRVESIAPTDPTGPLTNARSLTYTVTFSEPVNGVTTSAFQVVGDGVTGTVSTVLPISPTVYQVTIANVNGNGSLKLRVLADGLIHDVAGNPLQAPLTLWLSQTDSPTAVGNHPRRVAVGDLNGDGKLDLVSVSLDNATADVAFGNGDGSFGSIASYPIGGDPFGVTIDDVNGDGKPDIIVVARDNSDIDVLLNNGDGTFAPAATYGGVSGQQDVVAADFNGDGKIDLAVAGANSNTVGILLGNGDGTFGTVSQFNVGATPVRLKAADLNNDGKIDLVVTNLADNTISVLLGNGDGTFQTQQTFGTTLYAPKGLTIADLNGDGIPDVAVTSGYSDGLAVLLGNGNGTFGAAQTYDDTSWSFDVAAVDIDHDGKIDLITAGFGSNNINVLLGNGNGTFSEGASFATGGLPENLVVADLNGDGKEDVLTADYDDGYVNTLLNGGVPLMIDSPAYTIDQTSPTAVIEPFAPLDPSTPTNASEVEFKVTFSEPVLGVSIRDFQVALTGGVSGSITNLTTADNRTYMVTVGNLTGSGHLGLNLVDDRTIHDAAGNYLRNPEGSFGLSDSITYSTTNTPIQVISGDVNDDGKADLITVNSADSSVSVYLGNGNGTFAAPLTYSVDPSPQTASLADLNNDGKLDLVVGSATGDVDILLGNGDGTFGAFLGFSGDTNSSVVSIGDVNHDGIEDIVTDGINNSQIAILLGNGDGTFQTPSMVTLTPAPDYVTLADLNGDGKLDMIDSDGTDQMISVAMGNGDGTFLPSTTLNLPGSPRMVAVGDLNGDGIPDLVASLPDQSLTCIFLGNGDGTFGPEQTIASDNGPGGIAIGDVNADGHADIVESNFNGGSLLFLLGNGDGTFQAEQTYPSPSQMSTSVALADFNQDGLLDVASNDANLSTLLINLNQQDGNVVGPLYTVDHTDPKVVSIDRDDPAGPLTNADTLTFQVIFSEPVVGVDTSSFALATTGTAQGTIASVSMIDGKTYNVVVNNVSGAGSLGLNLVDNGAIHDLAGNKLGEADGSVAFAPPTTIGAGVYPIQVSLVDVNNDGKLDMITTNVEADTVSILLGNGDGTFQSPMTLGSGQFQRLEISDLNHDGNPDIVVTDPIADLVGVFLGNGDGSFQSELTFEAGYQPHGLSVADFNDDGNPDIVVTSESGQEVSLLLGNGDGTFASPTTWAIDSGSFGVAAGDVNGDGKPDIVATNYTSNDVSVLLGNGDGTFQNETTYATGSSPSAPTLADVNGDGKLDIIVNNKNSSFISVLLGNGDGTFQTQSTYTVGSNATAVTVGDINGDGIADLVLAGTIFGEQVDNDLEVLLGNGDGTFKFTSQQNMENLPTAIALGDVDGDGRLDVAAANYLDGNVSLFLSDIRGDFTGEAYDVDRVLPSVVSIDRDDPVGPLTNASTLTFDVTFSEPVTGLKPSLFKVVGNGVQGTVVAVDPISATSYRVTVGNVQGNGTLGLNLIYGTSIKDLAGNPLAEAVQPNFSVEPDVPASGSPTTTALVDMNGDGKLDLIATDYQNDCISIALGNGNGTFAAPVSYGVDATPMNFVVTDMNGDSKPDLAVAVDSAENGFCLLINNGDGTFGAPLKFESYPYGKGIAVANFDGDEHPDVVVGSSIHNSVNVYLDYNGTGFGGLTSLNADGTALSIVTGDFNHDGKTDIAVLTTAQTVDIFLGNGDGTFAGAASYFSGDTPMSLAIGDLNGDGNPDLAVSNYYDGTVSILFGNSDGTFADREVFPADPYVKSVGIADINGDGIPDVVSVANFDSDDIKILLGNGNGTFIPVDAYYNTFYLSSVAFGDLNGDSRIDFVTGNYGPSVNVYLNQTDESFVGPTYTIDQVLPYVTNLGPLSPLTPLTNARTVTYQITFSEPVTGVTSASFQIGHDPGLAATITDIVPVSATVYNIILGVAGSGTLNLNFVDNGSVHDLAGNPLRSIGNAATFHDQTLIGGMSNPHSVVIADVNGDGQPDLVEADYGNSTVGVFLGNGDGTFGPAATYAAGPNPLSVVAVDVNHDGKLDLVVADQSGSANCVSILLGNGDGTFGPAVSFQAGLFPQSVSVGDLNDDGNPDLVVTDEGDNAVSVLLGNGDGTFAPQTTYEVGTNPRGAAIADLNGDGKPDLVVANYNGNTISILFGNGDGTFGVQTTLAAGNLPRAVTVADVNGDGKPDILAAIYGENNVAVFLGNGDGTFAAKEDVPVGSSPAAITTGDLNGDGKLDIVVANYGSSSLSYLIGNGNGTFRNQQTLVAGVLPYSVAIGDLNHDGHPDIVDANYLSGTIGIYLSTVNGSVQDHIGYDIDQTAPAVVSIDAMTPSNTDPTSASTLVFNVTFSENVNGVDTGDFALATTGTATGSILSVDEIDAKTYHVTVNVLSGAGTIGLNLVDDHSITDSAGNTLRTADGSVTFDSAATYFSNASRPYYEVTADVNGDGKPDLIVSNADDESVSVYLGNGDGTFGEEATYFAGSDPTTVAIGDINGDGKLDIIVGHYNGTEVGILLGNGDGTFGADLEIPAENYSHIAAVGDVNGDGNLDIVTSDVNSPKLSVLIGNGDGTFQWPITFDIASPAVFVKLADVNNDGKLDLIVAQSSADEVSVFLGNGDGTFGDPTTIATGSGPMMVETADLNGDGNLDLIVADYQGNDVSVLLGNGDGTFQPQPTIDVGSPAPTWVNVADFNRDGKLDILVLNNADNGATMLLGNGDGTFADGGTISTGQYATTAAVGDFNGDGALDFATASPSGNITTVALNTMTGDFTGELYTIIQATATSLTSSDDTSEYGQTVTFTATVKHDGTAVVVGTVTFYDGETLLGTVNIDANGIATFSMSNLPIAGSPHSITAVYNPGEGYETSENSLSQTVTKAGTTTGIGTSPDPVNYGQTAVISGTVSPDFTGTPTGTVKVMIDGEFAGTANLDGSGFYTYSALGLSAGSHGVQVIYLGDSNFLGSSTEETYFNVNRITPTMTVNTADPSGSVVGAPLGFDVTLGSEAGTPGGTVNLVRDGTVIATATLDESGHAHFDTTFNASGSHTYVITYSGDTNFLETSQTPLSSVTVTQASSTTTLTVAGSTTYGLPVTLTATMTTQFGAAAVGTVSFYNGPTLIGTATVDSEGIARLTTTNLPVGTDSLTAAYSGAADFLPSSSYPPQSLTIVQATSRSSGLVSSDSQVSYGQDVTLTATFTASSASGQPMTGTVAFYDGDTYLGSSTIGATGALTASGIHAAQAIPTVSGHASLSAKLGVGQHTIKAIYSGDAHYSGATSQTTVTVNVTPATTTSTLVANTGPGGTILTTTVTVTSPGNPALVGTVSFYDGDTLLGVVPLVNGQASLNVGNTSTGVHAFRSVFNGNGTATSSAAEVSAASDNPAITSLARYGYHDQPTYLLVRFNEAMNAASVQNTANYRIVRIGAHGRVIGHPIAVKAAFYNADDHSATLIFSHKINVHFHYRLTVSGASAGGVLSASGTPLGATSANRSGADLSINFSWKNVAGRAGQLPKVTRALLNALVSAQAEAKAQLQDRTEIHAAQQTDAKTMTPIHNGVPVQTRAAGHGFVQRSWHGFRQAFRGHGKA